MYALAKESLCRLVGAEEECRAGGGADDGGPDAAVDAGEAARGEEAGGGLEAGLEGVEGEEGEVDGCSCEGAGEEGGLEGWRLGSHCGLIFARGERFLGLINERGGRRGRALKAQPFYGRDWEGFGGSFGDAFNRSSLLFGVMPI